MISSPHYKPLMMEKFFEGELSILKNSHRKPLTIRELATAEFD